MALRGLMNGGHRQSNGRNERVMRRLMSVALAATLALSASPAFA